MIAVVVVVLMVVEMVKDWCMATATSLSYMIGICCVLFGFAPAYSSDGDGSNNISTTYCQRDDGDDGMWFKLQSCMLG